MCVIDFKLFKIMLKKTDYTPRSFYGALIIRNEYVHRAKILRPISFRSVDLVHNHGIRCDSILYHVHCTQQITDPRSAPITPLLSLAPPSQPFRSTHSDFLRMIIYCMFYPKNSQLHISHYTCIHI